MMKKLLVFGTLSLIGVTIVFTSVFAADGTSTTKVDNCAGLTNGIQITRSGRSSTLTDGCRNAGHGMRNYIMTCVSAKLYRTSWKENCAVVTTTTTTPTPIPASSTTVPILSLVLSKNNGNGKVTANISVTNAASVGGISRIDIYRDMGSLVKTCSNASTCSYDYSVLPNDVFYSFPNGWSRQYLASAKAYGLNGQVGTVQPQVFTLFKTESNAPTQTFTGNVTRDRAYSLRLYSEDFSPLYRMEIKDGATLLTDWYSPNAYDSVHSLTYSGTVSTYGVKRFTARSTDWFGNVSESTLDLNFFATSTSSITVTASKQEKHGIDRVYLFADVSSVVGVREVQFYVGPSATSQFLVERLNYYSTTLTSRKVSTNFPKALLPTGYYYARLVLSDGTTKDTPVQAYSF